MIPIKDDNPRAGFPLMTIGLLIANVMVFYFEITAGYTPIIEKYALYSVDILHGQRLSTLISSMFLHGGVMHLVGNMLYLWIFGDNVESYLGHVKFVFFYLITGLCAAFAHIFLSGISDVPMVGASGAISGVLGAYLIKYPRANVLVVIPIIYFITVRRIPALIVLGFWFLLQLFYGLAASSVEGGGVAFWAHVGGFSAGMLLIMVFPASKRRVRYSGY
jgi:membrane associated rhomboid family serine protease